jgi:uncharacterized protein (DUF4415 family)
MKSSKTPNTFNPARGYDASDWAVVSDSPEATPEELAQARPFSDVFPELAASARRVRGKQKAPIKTMVTLRMDTETLEAFKATGKGWQTRIDAALKAALPLSKR